MIAVPLSCIEWLPAVNISFGVRAVSAVIRVILPGSRSSSSAASWISGVLMPCPSSTLPVNTVTRPSAPTLSQESRYGVVFRLPGRLGAADLRRVRGQEGAGLPAELAERLGAPARSGQGEGDGQRPAAQRGRCAGTSRARSHAAHRRAPSRTASAARRTARKMRMCVPQRQRLAPMCARISSSVGSRRRSSSAWARTIMPAMQ